MLELEDIQALFSRIKENHPNTPADKIPRLTVSVARRWIEALDGYTKAQILKAADDHAMGCRYWPDLSEIMRQLPERKGQDTVPMGYWDQISMQRQIERWQRYDEAKAKELKRCAVEDYSDNCGMTYQEWYEYARKQGVDWHKVVCYSFGVVCEEETT